MRPNPGGSVIPESIPKWYPPPQPLPLPDALRAGDCEDGGIGRVERGSGRQTAVETVLGVMDEAYTCTVVVRQARSVDRMRVHDGFQPGQLIVATLF